MAAATLEQARAAAQLVSITYADHPDPPIYTIDAAIAAKSFFDGSTTGGITTDHELESGPNVDKALTEDGLVRHAARLHPNLLGEQHCLNTCPQNCSCA